MSTASRSVYPVAVLGKDPVLKFAGGELLGEEQLPTEERNGKWEW
jgi:hypothetical protein